MNKYIFLASAFFFQISAIAAVGNEKPISFELNESRGDSYPQFSIVGAWTYQVPNLTSCAETYEFHADKTLRATSGKQVVDSKYTITEQLSKYAFYELKHEVITSNFEKDCDGEISALGFTGVNYVRFDNTGEFMVMCGDESALLENCFGPLKRD